MTPDQFTSARHLVSFTAGINQRYHQRLASHWARRDRAVRIAVGFLAVAGLILSIATPTVAALNWLSILTATLAAIAAVALNVIPLGDWQRDHLDLFRRWTDLREDIATLRFDADDDELSEECVHRLRSLEAKMHRLCGAEPACRRALLKECEAEERESRGADAQSCAA